MSLYLHPSRSYVQLTNYVTNTDLQLQLSWDVSVHFFELKNSSNKTFGLENAGKHFAISPGPCLPPPSPPLINYRWRTKQSDIN